MSGSGTKEDGGCEEEGSEEVKRADSQEGVGN